MNYYLSPSILASDLANVGHDIEIADNAGCDFIHIDVMDGHFVDHISYGLPLIKAIRPVTKKVLDVHMMVENPDKYVESLRDAGADIVTVHYEADPMIHRTLTHIRDCGMHPAVAINPGTPVDVLAYILQDVDMVLVMTVDPGYGGQKLIPVTLEKVNALRHFSETLNIEVDGGVNLSNVAGVIKAGANVVVAGSAVFKGDIELNVKRLINAFPGEDGTKEEGKLISFPRMN